VVGLRSASDPDVAAAVRLARASRSDLAGSRNGGATASLVELSVMLLLSKGMLDFLLKNGASAGDSLGDSYALGIAGTGGTSSSSLPPELCMLRVFGVGNREVETFGGAFDCKDPVDVRAVLKL
jgi:hypothetical protein